MTGPATVSVIIAAWNADLFIERAVASALCQKGVDVEVIVADDCSTDGTQECVERLARSESRLNYIRLAQNAGPSGARNAALQQATGTYISVLDADDAMVDGRLTAMVATAEAHRADIVADNMRAVTLPELPGSAPQPFLDLRSLPLPAEVSLADYIDPRLAKQMKGGLGYLKPLFRRETLTKLGAVYDTSLRNSEDHYFVANLLVRGAKMIVTDRADYLYTVREGSISHRLTPQLSGAVLAAERAFIAAHGDGFSKVERQAAQRRMKTLRNQDAFEQMLHALKSKRLDRIVRVCGAHLKAWPHFMHRFGGIALHKLGLQSPTKSV